MNGHIQDIIVQSLYGILMSCCRDIRVHVVCRLRIQICRGSLCSKTTEYKHHRHNHSYLKICCCASKLNEFYALCHLQVITEKLAGLKAAASI